MANVKKNKTKVSQNDGASGRKQESEDVIVREKEVTIERLPEDEKTASKEVLFGQEASEHELTEKIREMDEKKHLNKKGQTQFQKTKSLQDDKKVEQLLELAKKKGVIHAINVAKKMNNPYVLDTLHDRMAKEGYYRTLKK